MNHHLTLPALLCVLLEAQVAEAQTALFSPNTGSRRYVLTILPAPRNFDVFFPTHINNRGDVLGKADASKGPFMDEPHAALYVRGRTRDLHLLVPGRATNRKSLPNDLNDSGYALFRAYGAGCDRHFLYHRGSLQEFSERTGRSDLTPQAINTSLDVVGLAGDPCERDEPTEAFRSTNSHVQLLGKLPPCENSAACDINDSGLVMGWVSGTCRDRTVLFSSGGVEDLGEINGFAINDAGFVLSPSGVWFGATQVLTVPFGATGFNNHNDVVGNQNTPWPPRGFLYANGQVVDLTTLFPRWQWIAATSINDRGQIVGYGRYRSGRWYGVLLTPRR